ncbi:PAS domain-containing sensor histidine kinase [Cognatilysobacter bugurensis]|uniref:histidine kinase n=1 Tax=Cognatilysobacter bugurensis TaxID=543356 RepID=A0A918W991_9GAMM|nr:PAS domain-containing sensor histidine kinase [Lysobacter bugurensis]GHA83877.1 hypothetical protein GCM10007067_22520 [Lysobacter bugurensis]
MNEPAPSPAALDYRALFDATPAPHLVLTPDLHIAAVNEAYLDATATTREELIGHHVFDAFPQNPDDTESRAVENLHASLLRVLERRTADSMPVQRYDIRVLDSDGVRFTTRYWSPINTPVFDDENRLTHILHRVVDVTSFVNSAAHATELEAELAAQALELQDANRRLKDANCQLKREHELREQFVLALSHDLRTPLSAATMGSHVIGRKANDADDVRRISGRVLANLERMDHMLRDLLDASRINAGGSINLSIGPCNLRDIARVVIDDLSTVHGDRFELIATEAPVGQWDCEALRRVIENLCTNAIRYGRAEGPVIVTVHASAGQGIVEVRNEGDPIPTDQQEAIFNAHVRQQQHELTERRGWGLGLTLVRGLVDAHGGSVGVHSAAGSGTVFCVRLPL